MGGAARRNNYHRAFSVQMQEAEANEQDLALHLLTTELYQLEPWKREERLERLMDKAQTDEDAKALFTALVRQGTWHVEIAGAIARRPRQQLVRATATPLERARAYAAQRPSSSDLQALKAHFR